MNKIQDCTNSWKEILFFAKKYQILLYNYLSSDTSTILSDLKNSLRNRDDVYYTLEIIKNLNNEFKEKLLVELFSVVVYGNPSNASTAKNIILEINSKNIRKQIVDLIFKTASNNQKDEDIIKDLAMLLYILSYKSELYEYVDLYRNSLINSDFLENGSLDDIDAMVNFE